MTIEQAESILHKPRFGDPLCLEAKQRTLDAVEEKRLRLLVTGKTLQCIMCGYRGDKDCPICKGAGEHVIPKEMADGWDLDVLQSVAEELGL